MSNRKLIILSIVAALMIVWAVIQSHIGVTPARAPSGSSYLLQGLDTAKIASILIGTGEDAVRLIREDNRFVVGNKDNYPAVTSKINDLITSCLDIRTVELMTSNAANHKELEVTEEKAKSVVKFLKNDGEIITGVAIGKTDSQTRSTYVRQVSSNDVYTTAEAPRIRDSAMDYIEKEIVNISLDDVVRVTVTGPNDSYTLKVDDSNDDNIILENIPEGKKLKKSDCSQVLSALSNLSFNDVKKESAEEGKLEFENTYVCESKDQIVYTFSIAKADEKTYVKCRTEYVGETEIVKERRKESKEELKNKEAKLLAHDRALNFTNKHYGWLYEIPEWKAKNLTRKLAELLEEGEKEDKEVEEASAKADYDKSPLETEIRRGGLIWCPPNEWRVKICIAFKHVTVIIARAA